MTNNDVLRRLCYMLKLDNKAIVGLFHMADSDVDIDKVELWRKAISDADQVEMDDKSLSTFLNGLIVMKRGAREHVKIVNEDVLTNNLILRKIKIALEYKSDDIINAFRAADVSLGEHELSAFLRAPKQRQFRPMKDQYLRNFLQGLQKVIRP